MDVVLVRWPHEATRREELAREGRLRLVLVDDGAEPPITQDAREDWVRVPADENDVQLRIEGLRLRNDTTGAAPPEIDPDGLLRFAGRWVSLPPVEARLMAALVERIGAVVSREQLSRSGWPAGAPGRNALDVHMLRLRRRIDELGLAIKTVRSRGYLLESASPLAAGTDARRQA